ncbi:MAG TPA: non-canonical purine NTP pyrophosphatase [Aggregatilineales bacterium]|nr:non-canonical purine NTP pyrophosphatase [Aggregatilineales bacterium]
MMTLISFLTGNPSKLALAQRILAPFQIELTQVDLSLMEPQADRVETVVSSKAQQGYRQLQKPVIAEDSGFFIEALKGFPGPYSRYVLETLGVDAILRLMQGVPDRSCRFISALTYIDAQGQTQTFIDEAAVGRLSEQADPTPIAVYSDWWRVFIPEGTDQPLSALPESERASLIKHWSASSVYGQFGRWFNANTITPG